MSDLAIDRSSLPIDKPSPKELKTGFEEARAGLAG
jgi:hypothetical protein